MKMLSERMTKRSLMAKKRPVLKRIEMISFIYLCTVVHHEQNKIAQYVLN